MNHPLSKVLVVSFFLSCITWHAQAQIATENVQYSEWEIDEVAVYESGALIQRGARVTLDANGRAVIKIGGLAKSIDAGSIQTVLPEGWGLSGHSFQIAKNPSRAEESLSALKRIDDALESSERTVAMRNALLAVYSEELAMIQANRKVGGSESLLVEDLIELADFWRSRVKELEYLMLELRMELSDLKDELSDLAEERQEILKLQNEEEGQIIMRIVGPKGVKGKVEVAYLAQDAFWRTAYDAEVSDDGAVKLKRFAHVVQKTGVEWNGLPIRFLAGNPLESLSPPNLLPIELSLVRSSASQSGYDWASSKSLQRSEGPGLETIATTEIQPLMNATGSAIQRLAFTPQLPVRISGNGTPERIPLETLRLNSDLTYLVMPEYSDESFQLAASADWSEAQLMAGDVQVVAGGAYRGVFEMALPAPGDTLEIPLGQDGRVRSSRKRLMELCSSSALGGTKRTVQAFQVDVVNQHSRSVKVRIVDRIPVSRSSDIEVFVESLDGGELDPVTGWITWEMTLSPGAQKTLSFSYKVEYPKKFSIQGL